MVTEIIKAHVIDELRRNLSVFEGLLTNVPQVLFMWKAEENKWCMLEVVCHLYDEEREDFRARIQHILENPEMAMKPIDPPSWVKDRQYLQKDFEEMTRLFLKERLDSISWLENLDVGDWGIVHNHPRLGIVTPGKLLVNWLAHDYLHIRQLTRIRYDFLASICAETLDYAGVW